MHGREVPTEKRSARILGEIATGPTPHRPMIGVAGHEAVAPDPARLDYGSVKGLR